MKQYNKGYQAPKFSVILLSLFSLALSLPLEAESGSKRVVDLSRAIDVPIEPLDIAVTKDEVAAAAAEELAAQQRAAEAKAVALKRAAEQKAAELKAAKVAVVEKKLKNLNAQKRRASKLRVIEVRRIERKLEKLKAQDLQATREEDFKITKVTRELAELKGEVNQDQGLGGSQKAIRVGITKGVEDSAVYEVAPGGSLSGVAAKAYSRPGYWRVLKLHNGVTPERLQAGQKIKAPSLDWLLADSDLSSVYGAVSQNLLKARRIFMQVEDKREMEKGVGGRSLGLASVSQEQIALAVSLLQKCAKDLSEKRRGVRAVPAAAILQLRSASEKMDLFSRGEKRSASARNLIHEHLSNSIVYLVLWAKGGFK